MLRIVFPAFQLGYTKMNDKIYMWDKNTLQQGPDQQVTKPAQQSDLDKKLITFLKDLPLGELTTLVQGKGWE